MLLIPLLAAPSMMVAATSVERRRGPAAGGAFAALPVSLTVLVLTVAFERGGAAAATLATGAATHVSAQVACVLAAAAILTRRAPGRGGTQSDAGDGGVRVGGGTRNDAAGGIAGGGARSGARGVRGGAAGGSAGSGARGGAAGGRVGGGARSGARGVRGGAAGGSVGSGARRGAVWAVGGGLVAFAGIAALLAPLPAWLAIAVGGVALAAAPAPAGGGGGEHTRWGTVAVGAGAAMTLVAVALATVELAGPAAAGAIGSFPAVSLAFSLVLAHVRGRHAAAAALHGVGRGLRAYLGFALTIGLAAPTLGIAAAFPIAVAACAGAYAMRPNSLPGVVQRGMGRGDGWPRTLVRRMRIGTE